MTRASYRQRPDGVIQIVRRGRWRGTALGLLPMVAAFALVVALSAAITLYIVMALPVLAGVGAIVLLRRARVRSGPKPAAPPTSPLAARTGTLHRVRDAGP
ncbi:MAG TPA: hypothetical protein VF400_09140 [Anaeromyxobacteraceae bacterium]